MTVPHKPVPLFLRMVAVAAIAVLPVPSLTHAQGRTVSIAQFEKSNFLVKYKLQSKDQWSLGAQGTNFSYSFADPESGRATSVEMGTSAAAIRRLGVSWNGRSTVQPARLTPTRQQFLTDLLGVCFPDVGAEAIVSLVRTGQAKNYPDGSNTMPRAKVGTVSMYVGTVGESRVVGIER